MANSPRGELVLPDLADDSAPAPSWLDALADRAREVAGRARRALDADVALQASMAGLIELAATRYALDPGATWRPGEPLKLLFAGYSGTRNTGADVRVEQMILQVRHLLGDDGCELSITTIDPALSRGYFRTVTQLHLPQLYPRFVFDTVHRVHGVIACEGSMFKSKFANALSTFMVGALGCAVAENKVAVGYGGEAGKMDPSLEALVRRYCRDALILCRNQASRDVLEALGVSTRGGTDTAWAFEPAPAAVAEDLLRGLGWDGQAPVVALCPINPFWWPVKPDVARGAAWWLTGAHEDAHYASVYFHKSGADVQAAQARYLDALASAFQQYRSRHACFPVIVGMEALDRRACEGLAERIGAPVLVSDEHDMYRMVAVLRRCRWLLSSRYHAIVCSMAGEVPSAGVTMDERIRNLMADRGTPELSIEVDDPELASKAAAAMERLHHESEALADGIGRCVVRNLERMGVMGRDLVDHLRERHPGLSIRDELGGSADPWLHLPPPPPRVEALIRRHA
jgi:polysaccharide pyruvyl transferase WcaK-like protein